jgi:hypothetical protein
MGHPPRRFQLPLRRSSPHIEMRPVNVEKNQRFRSFRTAAYALHLAIVIAFISLVTLSVVRSVLAMTPVRKKTLKTTWPASECLTRAEGFWRQLDAQRQGLTATEHSRKADADWSQFRLDWLRGLRETESECAVDAPSRAPLKNVFGRLEKLMDLYTTHAVQFAGEVGGAVDGFKNALDEGRRKYPGANG